LGTLTDQTRRKDDEEAAVDSIANISPDVGEVRVIRSS